MSHDAEARRRIEHDLDVSFLVEAAAGTGKTTALVGRIVRLVAAGRARITEVAAITFTERASGELVLRLRERLELARQSASDPRERARLDEALADFEAAYVGTIHGFCAELLRARPLDAGVDPSFVVLGEDEQSALLAETSDRFLEEVLDRPPEGVRRALARPRDFEPPPPRVLFTREIKELAEHRDQDPGLRRAPFDRVAEIEALLARIDALVAMLPTDAPRGDKLAELLRGLDTFRRGIADRERTRPRDHDQLEHELVSLAQGRRLDWATSGRSKTLGSAARAPIVTARDALLAAITHFRQRADADLAFCLGRDLAPAVAAYEAKKRALGALDSLDALLFTRTLLRQSRRARLALRERFRFLFVDEVQDVDPVQKDIVLLLAGSDPDEVDPAKIRPRPGALYLVGDPKQAIYGFRRADLRTYLALEAQLVPEHAEKLVLSLSFRPRPAIAALVNRAFEGVLDGANGQARHVPLEAQRPPMAGFPSVVALPSPRAMSAYGRLTRGTLDTALPDAIASFVRWLIDESGLTVEDPSTHREVPLTARHVGILFKQLKGRGTQQARALERYGIAHSFVAPEAFFERECIVAASALLSAIEWPDDALSVYATLRGPFVGVPDADLLAYRESVGPLHPLAPTRPEGLSREAQVVQRTLALLGQLHRERHGRALEATLGVFLEACEADVLHLLTDQRGEARALDQLRQIARRADMRGTTFRELARWLADRVEDPDLGGVDVAPDPERSDSVTLSTVHRAKGLEFPVVIVADPTSRPLRPSGAGRFSDPSRHVVVRELAGFAPAELQENQETAAALERAEALRLLYVAATRARDVLVVPTVGLGEIEDSWMAPLTRALVPADPRGPVTTQPAWPPFGDRSMLDEQADGPGVRPGHHAAHLDGHGVTYWDPQHLLRPVTARDPRGHTHLVDKVEGRSALEAEEAHEHARRRAIEDAAMGALDVRSARAIARTPLAAMLPPVPIVEVEIGAAGVSGARFGRLVQALAMEPVLDVRVTTTHARTLGASDAERDAAVVVITRLRSHPTLGPIVAAARLGVPYVLATDAGPVVWGRATGVRTGDTLDVVAITLAVNVEVARAELTMAVTALERAARRTATGHLAIVR